MTAVRNDWSVEAVREIFDRPFLDLVFDAARVHREHHDASEVQVNQLHLDQDGRVPGGLQLLPAVGALTTPASSRPGCSTSTTSSPPRSARRTTGATRVLHGGGVA